MNNDGRFKVGHKESLETLEKRKKSLKEARKKQADYHGMSKTKFYNNWRSMITRCRGTCGEDSKKKYRDKGISVCERWQNFNYFYEDMFPSYQEGLTIDRIKNELGYFKENCRWATPTQQANNKTNTVKIEYRGKRLSFREWSIELGISIHILRNRYRRFYLKNQMTLDQLFMK